MTTFLLFISLFLNIIALLAIINLYLRQNRFLEVEKKQEKMMIEMEEVISSYLVQMKEENESFISRMKKVEVHVNGDGKDLSTSSVTEANNGEENSNQAEKHAIRAGKVTASKAVHAYRLNAKTTNVHASVGDDVELPPIEKSITQYDDISTTEKKAINQVFSLKKQGLSDEEIARKLNKGKTEIALLLKFNQNHQE